MKQILRDDKRTRVQTINKQPSLTQPQFKEQCDVNHILKKYKKPVNSPT